MARMLADRDSTDLHLNLARRHQRLARRAGLTDLVAAIQPPIAALAAKQSTASNKDFDRQAAYDEVLAADAELDDTIRNLFDSATIFDRDNAAARTVETLFPDGGYSDIIDEPLAQEPATADALATKVGTLGAGHALASHATKLTAAAKAVGDALAAQDTAIRDGKSADAEEEIAQATLRRAFETNYLNARQAIGRVKAERLFPKANRSTTGGDTAPTSTPAPAKP
jgi:hypothetical protein